MALEADKEYSLRASKRKFRVMNINDYTGLVRIRWLDTAREEYDELPQGELEKAVTCTVSPMAVEKPWVWFVAGDGLHKLFEDGRLDPPYPIVV